VDTHGRTDDGGREIEEVCAVLTAKRLAAALAAAAARPSPSMRCASGLAREGRSASFPAPGRRAEIDTRL